MRKKPAIDMGNEVMLSQKELRQKIRETGRKLFFPKLGITVLGVKADRPVAKFTK